MSISLLPALQVLPPHAIEMVVNHLAASNRLLADGITASSIEHKLLLLPLLWICRSFRTVALAEFYRTNTVKITGGNYDKSACQYWWSSRLKMFYHSTPHHHLSREIHVILCKKDLYTGRTTEALSRAPFDGCAFPMARKFVFTFCKTAGEDLVWHDGQQKNAAARAAKIETNISAFVWRIKQMAPMATDFEVVGSAVSVSLPRDSEHVEHFLTQLFQTATRAVYNVDDKNMPLGLNTVCISGLVHIDIKAIYDTPVSQLVQRNAMTLQSLSIATDESGGVSGIVKGAGDIVITGNEVTLECLDIVLDLRMATMLKRYNMFTHTSHPRLHCVKVNLFYDLFTDYAGTDDQQLQSILQIAPNAPIWEISGVSSSRWFYSALPVFANYDNLKTLILPDTRLDLWKVINLVSLLPLLTDLDSCSPIFSPMPANVTKDELPAYLISNYGTPSKVFQCWRVTFEVKWVGREEIVASVLLLALVCPNFNHVAVRGPNRQSLMAHMKALISTKRFEPYAPRLQRLLSDY
ncbi:hypothetical protein GGI20_005183 [Coemansia sp. BCRC 34301]|nr:hypothetical protein GGI20_005183 [Coemansia sp. BCRC 34301]